MTDLTPAVCEERTVWAPVERSILHDFSVILVASIRDAYRPTSQSTPAV